MEQEKVRLRTYQQVWAQERVIYQIERVRLPFPVSFRQAGVFAVVLISMIFLSGLPGFDLISPLLRYVAIPAGATWFLTRQRLDGKSPLLWLLSIIRFYFAPKRLNRLRPVPETPRRLRLKAAIGYRLKG